MNVDVGAGVLLWCALVASGAVGCGSRSDGDLPAATSGPPTEAAAEDSDSRGTDHRAESPAREEWPDSLVAVVDAQRERGAEPTSVEVRFADPDAVNHAADGGYYWRMPADEAAIEAHLEELGLEEVPGETDRTGKMFERYPKSWPKPNGDDVTWYAWPYNRDDTSLEAHFWKIMVHDEREKALYVYYWIWDVGI